MMLTRRMLTGAALALAAAPLSRAAEPLRIGGTGAALGLLRKLVEPFAQYAPEYPLEVISGLGSAGAISAVSQGAIDIAISGRKLNTKELATGLDMFAFAEAPFAFVTATPEAYSLSCLDVGRMYAGEAHKLPNGETVRVILRPRSDATTLFMIANLEGFREVLEKARMRPDVPVAATDQENLDLASRVPNALTCMTLMQHDTEPNALQLVTLDGTTPGLQTMRSGAYPFKMQMELILPARHARSAKGSLATDKFLAFLQTSAAIAIFERASSRILA
ncbi:MAG: substrate-binding domain-containing protein [Bosea sp. (in: a-proteobacteria)]